VYRILINLKLQNASIKKRTNTKKISALAEIKNENHVYHSLYLSVIRMGLSIRSSLMKIITFAGKN